MARCVATWRSARSAASRTPQRAKDEANRRASRTDGDQTASLGSTAPRRNGICHGPGHRDGRPHGAARGRPATCSVRARREEYGGLHWGSAFFGWLVAVGIAALLTAILSAAGAAIGLTSTSGSQATADAGTIGIVGGILLLLVLLRGLLRRRLRRRAHVRFDGPRQGLARGSSGSS